MRKLRLTLLTLGILTVLGVSLYLTFRNSPTLKDRARRVFRQDKTLLPVRCEVVHPALGGLDRRTTQPGTVMAYESVDLYAEASGYLDKQTVDIGDSVKKGDLLAVVAVPDLEKQQEKAKAVLAQTEARVGQMKASVQRALAEAKAATVLIPQAEAALSAARAMTRYREKVYRRQMDLYRQGGLEERLVDEAEERRQSTIATEKAAAGAVDTARAQEEAARAKVDQARADVLEAEASVRVAQAEVERIGVQINFARIVAPFPGIITRRTLFPGGFVRSARDKETQPLLSIDRTDKVRIVLLIPDREAPFADKGDAATIEVDALAGKTYRGYVARTQRSQDPATRTMRAEIDLDNPEGELRPGMFGKVSIMLQKAASVLSLPSGCLIGQAKEGRGQVYCVRDGKAALVPVTLGIDNGVRVEILSGVTAADVVVRRYSGSLHAGSPINVAEAGDEAKNNH